MASIRSLSVFLVLALAGCGTEARVNDRNFSVSSPKEASRVEAKAAAEAPALYESAPGRMAAGDKAAKATALAIQTGLNLPPGATPSIARKIIYDAQVELIVDSVDPVAKKVGSLVQDARGYVADQNVTGSPGTQRSMRWRFRIPVEQFDSFVDSIVALGELERNNRTSQDVTEQYYDLEARIKNKRVEEQTLNKILQERSGKLEDVLKIEVELSRVRGEIEQFEGKIRVLESLSSLATLTLNIRERDKYAPAAPIVADFGTQIARTWGDSLLDLKNMGKSAVLWAVSWAIWIPFLVVAALVAWILLRWLIRVFLRNLPRLWALARTPIAIPRPPTPNA
jgi:hypothetical protein